MGAAPLMGSSSDASFLSQLRNQFNLSTTSLTFDVAAGWTSIQIAHSEPCGGS